MNRTKLLQKKTRINELQEYAKHFTEEIQKIVSYIKSIVEKAPYKLPSLPSHNSNKTIINRYASQVTPKNDFEPKYGHKKQWSAEDDNTNDSLLKENKEKEIISVFKDRKKKSIKTRINERKDVLAQRPLESFEIPFIDKIIFNKFPIKEVLPYLKCRCASSIPFLISKRMDDIRRSNDTFFMNQNYPQ